MRIVFAGTPQVAVPTLHALMGSSHRVVAVLTRPPARVGRGRQLQPSPVADAAAQAGVPLIETRSVKTPQIQEQIAIQHADLGVIVAFGAIVPPAVLAMPTHGWINLHFSDLPRWRGAAPVQRALLAGDTTTASCVFQLEAGLDTGPVYSRIPVAIGHETAGDLLERMGQLGASQIVQVVDEIAAGIAQAKPQPTVGVTLAPMLSHDDGFVSFTQTAHETDCRIRAVTPDPGAWTLLPGGTRMKLLSAHVVEPPSGTVLAPGEIMIGKNAVVVGCSQGAVQLDHVAPAGKGRMDGAAWGRGARLPLGARLGTQQENA